MILFLRLLPVFSAAWFIITFRLALNSPTKAFWYFTGVGVAGVLAALWLLVRRVAPPQGQWSFLAFPALTLVATVGTLLFSERASLQWVLLVGVGVLIALYAEQAFRFTHAPARYQPNALVNLGFVFAICSIFFTSLTIFDLQLFAGAPYWLAIALFVGIITLWCTVVFRFLDAPKAIQWPWGLTMSLVAGEIFALLAWLPALPFVKAAIIALLVTGILQRMRDDVIGVTRSSRWTTVVLAIMLLCVLVTARWFA